MLHCKADSPAREDRRRTGCATAVQEQDQGRRALGKVRGGPEAVQR